ncbi:MAG: ATP synthase F1 subunit delta [Planctomycetota bacterium]|nr:ATP synthase F1 subunit delta [Planctomycetota bacterium]
MPLLEIPADAVALTYARSLYDLASERGGREKIEEVLAELEDVLEIARHDAEFAELLSSRSVTAEARGASLRRIFAGRVTDLTLNFLLVLNAKKRIGALPAFVEGFDSLVQQRLGRVEVDVFTAERLDAASLASLRERLQGALSREVVLHPYIDPQMIGGVKLRIGDQLIDGSIATKLRRLKDQLATDGAAGVRARLPDILSE